jgi:uncharacterized RDD family membrane protein YckC
LQGLRARRGRVPNDTPARYRGVVLELDHAAVEATADVGSPGRDSVTTPSQPPVQWNAAPPAPVGPAAGLQYGGFLVRVVAFILDAIVLGVITSALAPFAGTSRMVETSNGIVFSYQGSALSTLLGLVYFIGFWTWRGQTPGMIPFNMRVVMADTGEKPDVVRSLLRYVGLIISFVVILLGVIWVAFDARKQGWHDKIANTLVVRPA